ncbi:MAG: DoxX family protein [Beijerinckiaceae bacterium]|nr:DoxX family protein [Beijerinckiaceae bacterium]
MTSIDHEGAGTRLLAPGLAGFYEKATPFSWLIIRVAVGSALIVHGWPKIGRARGPGELMAKMPELASIGAEITFVLMIVELIGGVCITLGLATRFFAAAAAVEMAVLTFYIYWGNGYAWTARGYEYTLMWGLVLFAVALRGGGPWSVDRRIGREL